MKAEDIIERYEAMTVRRRLILAVWAVLILAILGIGINTVVSGFLGAKHKKPTTVKPGGSAQVSSEVKTADISEATFSYLAPTHDDEWTFNKSSLAYEVTKGVVKYTATRKGSGMVTISQQAMPEDLKPRESTKFTAFINDSKVTRSQDVGGGKVYFLPALLNGAPANGADTIIYATDDILLFGRAGGVLGYDVWVKLLGTLEVTVP